MSIRFTTPKGNPVVIRRPELIVSLTGYQRPDPATGEMLDHTAVTFENREVLFVSGHADVIEAALAEYTRVVAALAAGKEAFVSAEPELPSWPWPGCPHKQCPTPGTCNVECKVVESEQKDGL